MTKKAAAPAETEHTVEPMLDTPPTPEEARQMFKENDRLTMVMTTEGEMQRP